MHFSLAKICTVFVPPTRQSGIFDGFSGLRRSGTAFQLRPEGLEQGIRRMKWHAV